jgi:hypothetical protein
MQAAGWPADWCGAAGWCGAVGVVAGQHWPGVATGGP